MKVHVRVVADDYSWFVNSVVEDGKQPFYGQNKINSVPEEARVMVEGLSEAAQDMFFHWKISSRLDAVASPAPSQPTELPPSKHPSGYDYKEVLDIIGKERMDEFSTFMRGQTMMMSDAGTIFYHDDVRRFVRGLPCID